MNNRFHRFFKIDREKLYEEIWKIPTAQLAKKYDITDVALSKICKKLNVPKPPRGYWARISAGQQVGRQKLPKLRSGQPSEHHLEIRSGLINSSEEKENDISPESKKIISKTKTLVLIHVSKALRNPHPLIQQASEHLELSRPNDIGIIKPSSKNCLDICVSKDCLRRALRIMDALIKILLNMDFEVFLSEGSTWVRIFNTELSFGISEETIIKKVEPKDMDLNGYYEFGHSRYDQKRVPSGNLCLLVHDSRYFWGKSMQRNWRDTKHKRLEDNLDGFVKGLLKLAVEKTERQRREQEEERQRIEMLKKREEEARRRAELERQIKNEQQKISQLIQDAEDWGKSKVIREFIAAVKKERFSGNQVYEVQEDFDSWLRWAKEQADRLDPLTPNPPSVLDENPDLSDDE
jgi:hypothetical protein